MTELPEFGDLDFLSDFELLDNTINSDLDLASILNEDNSAMLPEEIKQNVSVENSKENKEQRKAPTFIEISDEKKSNFIENMKNKNTVRKTQSAVKQFTTWLQLSPRNETREINRIPTSELDNFIGSFLLSIWKADGSEYEPDTLTSYHRSIDRYLKEKKYPYSLVNDKEFETSRTVLMSKRKELKQKGKGSKPNAAEPLTVSEENKLKEEGCIGLHSPKALLNKIWLQNTMLFGIRGGTENHKLQWADIELCKDENGKEYLEFHERDTKTRTGEVTYLRAFRPKQFANPDDPLNCPVEAYKTFRDHRPPSTKTPSSPFYVAINHKRTPDSQFWYKNQPIGENSLRSIMKDMATKANLPGKKTNHSAPASCRDCSNNDSTTHWA
ncbi:uncharacterized protein KIAA1958 homolog [Saccostrea cucullata]|uniref:uncharacterized protein KIAA1958 homolog n=1 Tax=Saccostrea cuccullata TaxID=36930 RepID=UPI002ED49F0F